MTNQYAVPAQPEQFVLTIGDIGVSPSWVVTPNGTAPLRESQWTVQDRTFVTQTTPTWAIVMAVLGIVFCLLGLLFLIVKENQTSGYTEVTVRSGNLFHVVQLPANSPHAVAHARQLVYQAQSMAAAIR
ncbi:MAG: hypothetical protein ABJH68_00935 [Ilumatobacter sp.]|uniref:hypothetical protein n=1 Tax=Ilumatobacter sp. TaxID=1967498 RepID=UPI00329A4558